MGYTWLGMRKLTWEEVLQRHEKGELAGCFRLYDDNSEAMIDRGYDFAGDILAHHKKGGEFGEEIDTVDLELADGKKITAPAVVDVSALGCMDELEYELWHVIEDYMVQFGIRTQDDEPDWATVKAVQDSIFTAFTDAGVCYSDIIQEIYALVDQSYKDYQRKLKELYGKEAHEKIMDALNVKKAEERYIYGSYMFGECNTYIDEPIPKTLFYEPYSDRFFESTIVDVMQVEYRNICQN